MYFEYADFPQLPAHLESMCLDLEHLEPNARWPNAKPNTVRKNNPGIRFGRYQQFLVPEPVRQWLEDNGILEGTRGVPIVHHMFDGEAILPHIDYPRTRALNYILTPSTATTCFYTHKTLGDIKPSASNVPIDIQELDLVNSVVLEHHRWHYLKVDCIHNVTDITVPRTAITISI